MIAGILTTSTGLDTDQFNGRIGDEGIKDSGRIAAASDAGHDDVR
jgi:hypothetical protein